MPDTIRRQRTKMITRCIRDDHEMISRCSREGDCKTLKMKGIWKQQNKRQNLERKRIGCRRGGRRNRWESYWPKDGIVRGNTCAIWTRKQGKDGWLCYEKEIKEWKKNYGTRKENQIGSTEGEVAKMATLPVSGFCDGGAALWVVQEKETQPELAQRRETERVVEFGVGTGFCRVLRLHDGVKHVRKWFANGKIWWCQIFVVILHSLSER